MPAVDRPLVLATNAVRTEPVKPLSDLRVSLAVEIGVQLTVDALLVDVAAGRQAVERRSLTAMELCGDAPCRAVVNLAFLCLGRRDAEQDRSLIGRDFRRHDAL